MYLQKFEIKKKTALVTGAGKGIGKASAIALAEAGADLIILSRTKSDLDKVKKQIVKLKRNCQIYVCDVSNYDEVKSVFKEIKKIDILINNAGTNRPDHFVKIKKEKGTVLLPKSNHPIIGYRTITSYNLIQKQEASLF